MSDFTWATMRTKVLFLASLAPSVHSIPDDRERLKAIYLPTLRRRTGMRRYVQVSRTPRRWVGVVRGVHRRRRSANARNRRGGALRVQAVLWGIGAAGTCARDRRAAGNDGDDAVAPVMTAQPGVASVGSAVAAPG